MIAAPARKPGAWPARSMARLFHCQNHLTADRLDQIRRARLRRAAYAACDRAPLNWEHQHD